ncbi:MAG: CopG family transcriptional regulator [Desulfovibrionaceae bacterium]|nr:CopG family transcriptional regulator [Desulfovibrionaceae bacterium]
MMLLDIPAGLEERLKLAAARAGKPADRLVREALELYLESLPESPPDSPEDAEDSLLMDVAMEAFRASGEKTFPIEDIMRRYGMEDRTRSS